MGSHAHHEEKKKPDKEKPHIVKHAAHGHDAHGAHGAAKGSGELGRLASIAGAPIEYWWRNAVKQIFANNQAIHNMVSFDRSGDAHYMHFGPKALGIKVPVQLGLLGLQLSSGALTFKNPIVNRMVGEALEEVAFELTDLYNKGKLDSYDVKKAAKDAAAKVEEKFKIMCQVVLEDDDAIAHIDDCIMMAASNKKNPIKRTLEQVKAQRVPLATGCRFCGPILQGLQKEEAMGEHGTGHSGGGHDAHGAKTAKKEVKSSGAEALGKFGEKYPEKVGLVYDFVKWWGNEHPTEAQHFLAQVDKEEEFQALANAPDHETRRTIARSMMEARGLSGSFMTWIKNVFGIGEKNEQSEEVKEYVANADMRFQNARRNSTIIKLLGLN